MIKIVSVEKIRQIEAAADAAGLSYAQMMENAGRATALRALELIAHLQDPRITILVGPGNNGGDGLVAGRIIAQESSAQVRFYLLKRRSEEDLNYKAILDAGLLAAYLEDDRDGRVLRHMVASADLLLDALFGIGVKLPLRDSAAKLLNGVKRALNERSAEQIEAPFVDPARPVEKRGSAPIIFAVDCPSGLDCDSGELDKNALVADETITFIAAKPGLFLFPGAVAVGRLFVSSIGLNPDMPEIQHERTRLVDAADVRGRLPLRPVGGHKGTFGKALIVAGSANYVGAAGLSGEAAYRSGAGLVTIAAPEKVTAALSSAYAEITWLPFPYGDGIITESAAGMVLDEAESYQALLIGPGIGRDSSTQNFLLSLLEHDLRNGQSTRKRRMGLISQVAALHVDEPARDFKKLPPLIIDADALNLLSEVENWWELLPENTILTPHPAEMARLCGLSTQDVQAQRWKIAREKAAEWRVVLLLKGAHSVIVSPDGQLAVLPFKTDALATAGTGDVLSGLIVGFLAQGLSPFDAAVCAGYCHGLAGDTAAEQIGSSRSVIAGDVISALGRTFQRIEARR